MILKITPAQPVYNYRQQNFRYHQAKDGLSKKKSASFASILAKAIDSKYANLNPMPNIRFSAKSNE